MRIVLTRREALDTPDGINIFLFSLAEALLESGHEVIVLSSAWSDREKLRQFYSLKQWPETVSLGEHRSIKYLDSLKVWVTKGQRVIKSLNPDVVILNGAVPLRLKALTCTVSHDAERRMSRIPYFRTAFKRYCYARSEMIVATCDEVRDELCADLGVSPSRVEVIPTCVQLGSYVQKPLEEREDAILHMGTVDYKNPEASIRAFGRMATPGKKLYITGKATEELKTLAASLPSAFRNGVEFLGYVPAPRLIELLGTVKVVSVPSNYAAPVASPTVIEALASGTPVVASPSISRQVLEDGVNGFMRTPEDEQSMALAYESLLTDSHVWKRMAANALQSSGNFSARRVADLYLRLINGHPTRAVHSAGNHQPVAIKSVN